MPRRPKARMYYMHPLTTFETGLDHDQFIYISHKFANDWHIVHPSPSDSRDDYIKLGAVAGYNAPYLADLANSCHGLVFLPFRDGKVPFDMVDTILNFLDAKYRVWELRHDGRLLHFRTFDPSRALTHGETLHRTFREDGTRKPY